MLEIPPLPDATILLVEVGSTAHGTGLPGGEALSRGQEKLAALACILGQAAGVAAEGQGWPLVCLDDLASAPHVSGAIAAFLSVRREFIGRPLEVKKIFLDSAIPLGRERYFEGHGLLDLMKAIQSV